MLNLDKIKPKDKNGYLLFGVVGAIIIALGLGAYFVFSPGRESEDSDIISSKNGAVIQRINVKEIDMAFFSNPKFVNLKDLKVDEPGLNELNIGQKTPFAPAQ